MKNLRHTGALALLRIVPKRFEGLAGDSTLESFHSRIRIKLNWGFPGIEGANRTRMPEGISYENAVSYVRDTVELSTSDKETLMAGSLRTVFNWPAT